MDRKTAYVVLLVISIGLYVAAAAVALDVFSGNVAALAALGGAVFAAAFLTRG